MSHYYHFKELNFKYGIFDNFIDTTYVLTMTEKGNFQNIYKQLRNVKPSKKIFIVFNERLKTPSLQKLKTHNTNKNLVQVYLEIFKHAQKNTYKNIMILEDNFIFDKEITYLKHISKINEFCKSYQDKSYCLSLGSLPIIILPKDDSFYLSLSSVGTCCMIYSKLFINQTLVKKNNLINNWNNYTNYNYQKYIYAYPLCTQLFNEKENNKNVTSLLKYFIVVLMKKLKLNKQSQPGFNSFYYYSKIFSILIFILILLILLYLIYVTFLLSKYL